LILIHYSRLAIVIIVMQDKTSLLAATAAAAADTHDSFGFSS
jgi:hypothetical protein